MKILWILLTITLLCVEHCVADGEEGGAEDGGEEEGVQCYVCTGDDVECISLQSYKSRYKLLQKCKTGCAVLLGQTGEIGAYDTSIKFARGCDDLEKCNDKNVNCCKCSSDECNMNNYCSAGDITSTSKILQIIIICAYFL
ncbi:uncharacterized protein [Musca autumnalis]|uniref:uncharacterized protein n=1 Tax=Musca autumnalis TaxID=221902 RepID=UPI003CEAA2B7